MVLARSIVLLQVFLVANATYFREKYPMIEHLQSMLENLGGDIVDYGGGSGYIAFQMVPHVPAKFRVHVVDSQPNHNKTWKELEAAEPRFKTHLIGHVDPIPLKEGSCGAVLISNALHHIPIKFQAHLFRRFAQVLQPEGLIVINDFLAASPLGFPICSFQTAVRSYWCEKSGAKTAWLGPMCILPDLGYSVTKQISYYEDYNYTVPDPLIAEPIIVNPSVFAERLHLPDHQRRKEQHRKDFYRVQHRGMGSFHRLEYWAKPHHHREPLEDVRVECTGLVHPSMPALQNPWFDTPGHAEPPHLDAYSLPTTVTPWFPVLLSVTNHSLAGLRHVLQTRLPEAGAILVQGLGTALSHEFASLLEELGYQLGEIGRTSGVGERLLSGHNMLYKAFAESPETLAPPRQPMSGPGGTPSKFVLFQPTGSVSSIGITDMQAVSGAVDQAFLLGLKTFGFRIAIWLPSCARVLDGVECWQNVFSEKEAAKVVPVLNQVLDGFNFDEDDALTGWTNMTGVVWDSITSTDALVYIQNILAIESGSLPFAFSLNDETRFISGKNVDVTYGNGSPIPAAIAKHVSDIAATYTVYFDLRPGDALWCDPSMVAFSRMPRADGAADQTVIAALQK